MQKRRLFVSGKEGTDLFIFLRTVFQIIYLILFHLLIQENIFFFLFGFVKRGLFYDAKHLNKQKNKVYSTIYGTKIIRMIHVLSYL